MDESMPSRHAARNGRVVATEHGGHELRIEHPLGRFPWQAEPKKVPGPVLDHVGIQLLLDDNDTSPPATITPPHP
jgi:hypothetical protein